MLRAEDLFSAEVGSVVSAGGSVYFDVVADVLRPLAKGWTTVLLRSGCYITHDHGMYGAATPADQPGWGLRSVRACPGGLGSGGVAPRTRPGPARCRETRRLPRRRTAGAVRLEPAVASQSRRELERRSM